MLIVFLIIDFLLVGFGIGDVFEVVFWFDFFIGLGRRFFISERIFVVMFSRLEVSLVYSLIWRFVVID